MDVLCRHGVLNSCFLLLAQSLGHHRRLLSHGEVAVDLARARLAVEGVAVVRWSDLGW